MKKSAIKTFALIIAMLMVFCSVPFTGYADQEEVIELQIVVNNTALPVDGGGAWYGQYISVSVSAEPEDDLFSLLKKALEKEGKSTGGIEKSTIKEIGGLANSNDEADYRWVCYINDKDINETFTQYSIPKGNIKGNDKIRFEYEMKGEAIEDIEEKENQQSVDTNNDSQSKDVTDGTEESDEKQLEQNGENSDTDSSLENTETGTDETIEESTDEELDGQEGLVEELPSMHMLAMAKDSSLDEKAYEDTGKNLVDQGTPGSSEGNKAVGLARSDNLSEVASSSYYWTVENFVKTKKGNVGEAKNSASIILGLTSIGRSVSSVGGYNLLNNLAKYDYVTKEGIYSAAWSLIALDSKKYTIPKASNSSNQTTREALVEYIISKQVVDGQWRSSSASDVETTALAIQALTPYYGKSDVKKSIDRSLEYISTQISSGTYYDGSGADAKGLSQIIIALTGMGKNLKNNSAFIYDGHTLIDNLMKYYLGNGYFKNTLDGNKSEEATEAAYNALTSYKRLLTGKTSFYNMSDIASYEDAQAAAKVIELIDAIDKHVTRNSATAIDKARKSYDKLSDEAKKLVTNYDKLIKAEEELAKIKKSSNSRKARATATRGAAKKANSLINSLFNPKDASSKLPKDLSKLTKKQIKEILAAYDEYDKLTDAQKKNVENYKEFEKLLKKLEKTMHTDPKSGIMMEGIQWNYKLFVKKQNYENRDIRKIERTTGNNAEVLDSYNIYIKDIATGKKFIPSEPVTIKIPNVNLKKHKTPVIAHEYASNKFEFIQCTTKDDFLIFETQTFSPFSVVGFDGEWEDIATAMEAKRIGELILGCIIVMLVASLIAFTRRAKKSNSMEKYIKKHVSK